MNSKEFKKKFEELFEQLDNKDETEILLMIVSFDNTNNPVDIDIIATGCLICHKETLEEYVTQENIQHRSSSKVH